MEMQANRVNPRLAVRQNRAATARERFRYFITFACYGARLVGSRPLEPDCDRVVAERRAMLQDVLDKVARTVVLAAIQRHCAYRG